MKNFIYSTTLFIIAMAAIIYQSYVVTDHLDNLADAFCYAGHVVMELEN